MISQEPTKIKWFYSVKEDGALACTDGDVYCPCCGEAMELNPDCSYFCVNDACPFVLSDAVQAVVTVIMESRGDDKSYEDSLIEACEIARSYTLDEEVFGEKFCIHDRETAGWYMKKIACKTAEANEINAEVDSRIAEKQAEIDAINVRRAEMLKPVERDLLYLTTRYQPELEEWAKSELKDSKSKTIKLTYGDAGTKKIRPQNVVDKDEDTVVFAETVQSADGEPFVNVKKSVYKTTFFAWLAEHPDHERVRVETDGTISLLEDNPFLPDGEKPAVIAHITPAGEEFFVKATMPGVA